MFWYLKSVNFTNSFETMNDESKITYPVDKMFTSEQIDW